jgi:hypothetical protein
MIFSFVFHFLVLRLACCGVVEREYEHMLEKRGLYVDNLFQYLPKNCRGADSHELQDKGDRFAYLMRFEIENRCLNQYDVLLLCFH